MSVRAKNTITRRHRYEQQQYLFREKTGTPAAQSPSQLVCVHDRLKLLTGKVYVAILAMHLEHHLQLLPSSASNETFCSRRRLAAWLAERRRRSICIADQRPPAQRNVRNLYSYGMKSTTVNLLLDTGDYSATSNTMKLVHWPLMGRLLLVQRGGYNKVDTKISMILYHDSIMIFFKQNYRDIFDIFKISTFIIITYLLF